MNKNLLFRFFLLLFLILFNVILFFNLHLLKSNKNFEVAFLDVGQGNATLFKYGGLNILVDSGTGLEAKESVYKNISFFDRDIDLIFATHYDLDHSGNIPDYLNKYNNSYLFFNGKKSDSPVYDEIFNFIKKNNLNFVNLNSSHILKIDENFYLKILFPDDNLNIDAFDENSASLVMKFIYGDKSILITGDLPSKLEKWLVEKYGDELKSDILVAGHHGSKSSSSEEFLEAVSPDYIIFSAGKNNSYGHPNQEVLDRVENLGIKYFRTDEVGTINFFVDDEMNWDFEF